MTSHEIKKWSDIHGRQRLEIEELFLYIFHVDINRYMNDSDYVIFSKNSIACFSKVSTHEDHRPFIYIFNVGVRASMRRKGIATQMIKLIEEYVRENFHTNSINKVDGLILMTDNTPIKNLYTKLGFVEKKFANSNDDEDDKNCIIIMEKLFHLSP